MRILHYCRAHDPKFAEMPRWARRSDMSKRGRRAFNTYVRLNSTQKQRTAAKKAARKAARNG